MIFFEEKGYFASNYFHVILYTNKKEIIIPFSCNNYFKKVLDELTLNKKLQRLDFSEAIFENF